MAGWDEIIGHERPTRVLRRAFQSGRVAHAYLFWGPDGIGKERVAREAAKVLLCADGEALARGTPCNACPSCVKMDAGDHPDLHLVAPGERQISVDQVRDLQSALGMRAFESGRKVAIIRDAFRMSREGANALLKTVEEPPAGTFLFLLAHHRSQLLPTLVSRCQSLRFDALAEARVAEWLRDRGLEAETALRLSAISGGSPGAALACEGAVEDLEEAARVVDALDRMGGTERLALAERWSKDKERLGLRLDLLERHWRRRLREGEGEPEDLERLHRVRGWIDRNVNVQLALDALFLIRGGEEWEETV